MQTDKPFRKVTVGGPFCAVEGCETPTGRALHCPMHAARIRRLGEPGEAERRMAPKGQRRHLTREGYVIVSGAASTRKGGRHTGVPEHRYGDLPTPLC